MRQVKSVGARWIALKDHDIAWAMTLPEWRDDPMMGWARPGEIITQPIDSEKPYLACLHEVGHEFHGHTRRFKTPHDIVPVEVEAWQYAFANCLVNPSQTTVDRAVEFFETYLVDYDGYWRPEDLDGLPEPMKEHPLIQEYLRVVEYA